MMLTTTLTRHLFRFDPYTICFCTRFLNNEHEKASGEILFSVVVAVIRMKVDRKKVNQTSVQLNQIYTTNKK